MPAAPGGPALQIVAAAAISAAAKLAVTPRIIANFIVDPPSRSSDPKTRRRKVDPTVNLDHA
jgi:hypothetical protein